MTQKRLVSIVVVTMNGKEYLKLCLPSLLRQRYSPCEVIILDNGSTDGTPDYVRENFPDFLLIENDLNIGYAEANNKGIQASSGEYILILNDDTKLEPECVSSLVETMRKSEEIGMCSSKVLSYFDHRVIDNVGHLIYKDGLNFCKGRGELDDGQYDLSEEVCFPSGCAAFYRRKMLDEIGLFDEDFLFFGEDADLGLRGRLAGWKCMYTPGALIYHRWSSSAGKYSPFKAFLVERNRLWVAVKIFPIPILLLSPFYTLWRYFFQAWSVFAKAGYAGSFVKEFSKMKLLKILLLANVDAMKHLPKMLQKRREVQKLKKVSAAEAWFWFKRFGIKARAIAFSK